MSTCLRASLGAAAALLLCLPVSASAAVIAVTNTDDAGAGSLRDVVEGAADGDVIVFSLPDDSVILLTGSHITIPNDIRILGPGPESLTISRGATNPGRAFLINNENVSARIEGLTIADQQGAFGGAIRADGDLEVHNCRFADNTGTQGAGIIASRSLTVTNTRFEGNAATSGGGGIMVARQVDGASHIPDADIRNCVFVGNTAGSTGAAINAYLRDGSRLAVRNSTFVQSGADNSVGCDLEVTSQYDDIAELDLSYNTFATQGCISNVNFRALGGSGSGLLGTLAGNLMAGDSDVGVQVGTDATGRSLGGNVDLRNGFAEDEVLENDILGAATGVDLDGIVDDGWNLYVPLTRESNALFLGDCASAGGAPVSFDQLGQPRATRIGGARVCTAGAFEAVTTSMITLAERDLGGSRCVEGGLRLYSGFDIDGDGAIDGLEVVHTQVICDGEFGEPGEDGVATLVDHRPATTCGDAGGVDLLVGPDTDGSRSLEEGEIESVATVCNGANGADGTDGTDGADGADGINSFVDVRGIAPGSTCSEGGQGVTVWSDYNDDGRLDEGEVAHDFVVCNGTTAPATVSRTEVLVDDERCPAGGVEWLTGLDTDGSGDLGDDEIDTTFVVCAGLTGATGDAGGDDIATIFDIRELATGDADCPAGGALLLTGVDANINGMMDDDEVDARVPFCNGVAAAARIDELEPGEACSAGGSLLSVGADEDGNGLLDEGETATHESTICDAVAPPASLLASERVDAADGCPGGATVVYAGPDTDGDGELGEDERDLLGVVCDGAAGAAGDGVALRTSPIDEGDEECPRGGTRLEFVSSETEESLAVPVAFCSAGSLATTASPVPAGETCANGGSLVRVGVDVNGDGVVDADEASSEMTLCNGAPAPTPVLAVSEIESSEACPAGGVMVLSGLDVDGDGALGEDEITSAEPVCNGATGEDGPDGDAGADGGDGADGAAGENGADGDAGSVSVVDVVAVAAGESQCADGGRVVRTGIDVDGDGALSEEEVTDEEWLCDEISEGSGCSTSGTNRGPAWFLLGLGALAIRRRRADSIRGLGVAVAALLILTASSGASAAVLAVTNTDDAGAGSLRDTVAASSDGDTIVFSLPAGSVIELTGGHIQISTDLRIIGPGAEDLTISRDPETSARAFNMNSNRDVYFSGIAINGQTGPFGIAVRSDNGSLTIEDCLFSGNDGHQGTIHSSGELRVVRTRFEDNNAANAGGAIMIARQASVSTAHQITEIRDSSFTGNSTGGRGAAINAYGLGGALFSVRNSTFTGSSAVASDGCDLTLNSEYDGVVARAFLTHNTFATQGCTSNVRARTISGVGVAMDVFLAGNLFAGDSDTPLERSGDATLTSLGGNVDLRNGIDLADVAANDVYGDATDVLVGDVVDDGWNVRVEFGPDSNALFMGNCTAADGDPVSFDQLGQARSLRLDGERRCTAGAFEPAVTPLVTTEIDPSACAFGGLSVHTGFDVDGDEELTGSEVIETNPLCNAEPGLEGLDGRSTLVASRDATTCDGFGGIDLLVGFDVDGSEELDEFEIESVVTVCNGTPGADGTDGADGADGAHGATSLLRVQPVAAGEICAAGGERISVGDDTDRDGELADDEVLDSAAVCNGEAAAVTISQVEDVDPGEVCVAGGVRWLAGVDADESGDLDEDEVGSTFVVCNGETGDTGETGADGLATVFASTELGPGDESCPTGGAALESGLDTNANGELDDDEADSEFVLCNGAASVARLDPLEPGDACPVGGTVLSVGDDENGNGLLDEGETLRASSEVCNADAPTAWLMASERVDAADGCPGAATVFSGGLDADDDGGLGDDEGDVLTVVCDGAAGTDGEDVALRTSTIEAGDETCPGGGTSVEFVGAESGETLADPAALCSGGTVSTSSEDIEPGEVCANGGTRLLIGLDTDANGEISSDEAGSEAIVCNAEQAPATLVAVGPIETSDACPQGGVIVVTGLDLDGDGTLGDDEVQAAESVCHGEEGADGTTGADGAAGEDGANGEDGQVGAGGESGATTLVDTSLIAPGDAECAAGGLLVRVGVDADGDGALSDEEVSDQAATCTASNDTGGGCSVSGRGNGSGWMLFMLAAVGLRRRRNSRTHTAWVGAVLAGLLVVSAPAAVSAAVLAVANTDDAGAGSLRDTITGAADGDTIVFSLPSGSVIELTGAPIDINTDIRILGPGADLLTVGRDPATDNRGFIVGQDAVVHIEGLTISGQSGATFGGAIRNNGDLTVEDCHLIGNTALQGAAILSNRLLTVRRTRFEDNTTSNAGGAIMISRQSEGSARRMVTEIADSVFIDNESESFGAGIVAYATYGAMITVRNSTFLGGTVSSGTGCDFFMRTEYDGRVARGFLTHNTFASDGCNNVYADTGSGEDVAYEVYLAGNLFAGSTTQPLRRSTGGALHTLGGNVDVRSGMGAAAAAENDIVGEATGVGTAVDDGFNVHVPLEPSSNALFLSECVSADGDPLSFDQLGSPRSARFDGERVCTSGAFEPAATPLVTNAPEGTSTTCPFGGIAFVTGYDINGDGSLTDREIFDTQQVCNGAPGPLGEDARQSLVETREATTCGDPGGLDILIGVDENRNGELDGEVDSTVTICNGAAGADGSVGADGSDGTHGAVSLVQVLPIAPGGVCPSGGESLSTGVDENRNGALEDDEIAETVAVCNGPGAAATLSASEDVEPGEVCPAGGVRWIAGVDADGSGELEEGEVDSSFTVCNGATGEVGDAGADGLSTVFAATDLSAGDEDCPAGGVSLASGLDDNGNAELDEDEVNSVVELCNGAASVARLDTLEPGDTCPAGGTTLTVGSDENGNGLLDDGEAVRHTTDVCNAVAPPAWLIASERVDAADGCDAAATVFSGGPDEDGDGALSEEEGDVLTVVCDAPVGAAGEEVTVRTSVIEAGDEICPAGGTLIEFLGADSGDPLAEPAAFCNGGALSTSTEDIEPGDVCSSGGTLLRVGLDADASGDVSAEEADSELVVCNGEEPPVPVVELSAIETSEACLEGGVLVLTGLDLNGDGALGDDEVDAAESVCHGADGEAGSDGAEGAAGQDGDDGDAGQSGSDGAGGTDSLAEVVTVVGGGECPDGGVVVRTGLDVDGDGALSDEEISDEDWICAAVNETTSGGCSSAGRTSGAGWTFCLLAALAKPRRRRP